jgi:hypothetical protein
MLVKTFIPYQEVCHLVAGARVSSSCGISDTTRQHIGLAQLSAFTLKIQLA